MATDLENGVENHKQKNFVSSPGSSSTSTEGPISDEGDAIRINENSTNDPVHFSPFRKKSEEIETYTSKYSPNYDLSHGRKLVMIFNHSEFKDEKMPSRGGTEKDVQSIISTFVEDLNVSFFVKRCMEIERKKNCKICFHVNSSHFSDFFSSNPELLIIQTLSFLEKMEKKEFKIIYGKFKIRQISPALHYLYLPMEKKMAFYMPMTRSIH